MTFLLWFHFEQAHKLIQGIEDQEPAKISSPVLKANIISLQSTKHIKYTTNDSGVEFYSSSVIPGVWILPDLFVAGHILSLIYLDCVLIQDKLVFVCFLLDVC